MSIQATNLDTTVEIVYPLTIESRFGDIVIHEKDVISMPIGIYGFEDYHYYAITEFAGQTLTTFHTLQCLDEIGLIFLLTPMKQQGVSLVPEIALREATDHLRLDFDHCTFYAITSVCEKENRLEFSLNLKAPIVVETQSGQAWQYILEQSDYPVKHVLKIPK